MAIKLSKNGKRLGRPPKKDGGGKVFIIDEQPVKYVEPVFDLTDENMIQCSLIPIPEYSHINSETKKAGRYAQSTYSLSTFGKSCYVVLAYLDTDFEKYRSEGISDEQIAQRCINYLNQSEQKKKTKKDSGKPYGNLKLYNYRVIQKFGKEIMAVEIVTDNKTNENFWGIGNR